MPPPEEDLFSAAIEGEVTRASGPPSADRIRIARELRGLTQQEAVAKMDQPITAAALSQIEAGRVRPSRETVEGLASALDVPQGFFFLYTRGPDSGGADGTTPYFRNLRATPARERKRAAALAVLLNDLVAAMEASVRLPDADIPEISVGPNASLGEIEGAAGSLRLKWGLGFEPVPHMVRELERHGVAVARLSMGHRSVDAFSVRVDRRPLVLLSDDKSNYVRSRFDAAHELGHLVLHRSVPDRPRWLEAQAHDFASALLIPHTAALEELPRRLDATSWMRLAELKRRWGISMAALLHRASRLGVITPDAYRNAMKYMAVKGWRTIEPGDKEMGPPEAPLLLERALRSVQVESGISVEQLIREAELPADEAMSLVAASLDRRPIVEL